MTPLVRANRYDFPCLARRAENILITKVTCFRDRVSYLWTTGPGRNGLYRRRGLYAEDIRRSLAFQQDRWATHTLRFSWPSTQVIHFEWLVLTTSRYRTGFIVSSRLRSHHRSTATFRIVNIIMRSLDSSQRLMGISTQHLHLRHCLQ